MFVNRSERHSSATEYVLLIPIQDQRELLATTNPSPHDHPCYEQQTHPLDTTSDWLTSHEYSLPPHWHLLMCELCVALERALHGKKAPREGETVWLVIPTCRWIKWVSFPTGNFCCTCPLPLANWVFKGGQWSVQYLMLLSHSHQWSLLLLLFSLWLTHSPLQPEAKHG